MAIRKGNVIRTQRNIGCAHFQNCVRQPLSLCQEGLRGSTFIGLRFIPNFASRGIAMVANSRDCNCADDLSSRRWVALRDKFVTTAERISVIVAGSSEIN